MSSPAYMSYDYWIDVLQYFVDYGEYTGPRGLTAECRAWAKDTWHCIIKQDADTGFVTGISVEAEYLTMLSLMVNYED